MHFPLYKLISTKLPYEQTISYKNQIQKTKKKHANGHNKQCKEIYSNERSNPDYHPPMDPQNSATHNRKSPTLLIQIYEAQTLLEHMSCPTLTRR